MNKPQLMSALGVSEKTARPKGDARARSTAQRSGVAKTYAADKLSAKLAGGDAEKAAAVKKEVLKRVSKNLRAAEKVKGDKLTPQEKRAAAAKAIRQVADEQRKASGKNIPLTQGMSPEQREKEKKQFLAQMKRQQTIAQKKADRPNLTAVDGGRDSKPMDTDRASRKRKMQQDTALANAASNLDRFDEMAKNVDPSKVRTVKPSAAQQEQKQAQDKQKAKQLIRELQRKGADSGQIAKIAKQFGIEDQIRGATGLKAVDGGKKEPRKPRNR